jgi:hypothetical protein
VPNPFIDAQDIVDYIGVGGTTDPGMLIALDSACDICRTIAEQDFNAGTATVSLDGTGTDCLLLAQRPVLNAGTVLVNGGTVTDYMLTADGRLLRGSAVSSTCTLPVWPMGRQNVQVTYEYGYTEVPRDVRMVALQIAARIVVQGVTVRETQGDLSVDYATAATDLNANELRILRKYRKARSF